jgi:hypothetical protein
MLHLADNSSDDLPAGRNFGSCRNAAKPLPPVLTAARWEDAPELNLGAILLNMTSPAVWLPQLQGWNT